MAFDCETTAIQRTHHWKTPKYVIGAAYDGVRGVYVQRRDVADFFAVHENSPFIFHNASFDLDVIHAVAPELDIFRRVDRNGVWDTQLLHRLLVLGTDGGAAEGKGQSTLEHCADIYLDVDLPKDTVDSVGQPVRTSYGKWLNRCPQEVEPIYLEYLAKDVIVTHMLYCELQKRLRDLRASGDFGWGYVSDDWLGECTDKWGPQTHHFQLRAAIVLRQTTANGMHIDRDRKKGLCQELKRRIAELSAALRPHGFRPSGSGSSKALQSIFKRLEQEKRSKARLPRTPNGKYNVSKKTLKELAETVPFAQLLLEYGECKSLLRSVSRMRRKVLHPSFDVLATTGRTTSFGEINAQNIATDDRVRSCIIPSPGNVFLIADYKQIELATLSQACISQFRLDSKMAAAINAGKDLHTLVAAGLTNKPESEVTSEERKKAKPINFGKPGGMGNAALKEYAKANYGLELTDADVEKMSGEWFRRFPEMQIFLYGSENATVRLAEFLRLTVASHYNYTGDIRFYRHPANAGLEHCPNEILARMLLKTVREPSPRTASGKNYVAGDVSYFWAMLDAKKSLLASEFRQDVSNRRPSEALRREVLSLVDDTGVFTATGRLRAAAGFCARHNTVFQGLAADGAKLALWGLRQAGYRIVNFIHDEVLIEVAADSDLNSKAKDIRRIMVDEMRRVVPDVTIEVSLAAARRWYKDAVARYDDTGERLLLWEPGRDQPRLKGLS